MTLQGKVVIVTGSSSGIGAATAVEFAKLGAKVVIIGRNEERLKTASKSVEATKGPKPLILQADLSKDVDVKRVVDETVKQFGQIDVLVNNAATGFAGTLKDGIAPYEEAFNNNVRSVYLLTSLAAPYLVKTKGNIVNISSIAAVRPRAAFTPYCMTKAALDMFTKCIAADLAKDGVRVNSVNPGPVKTNFLPSMGMNKKDADSFLAACVERSPLRYLSSSEDVADLIIFLASDKAKCITGSIYMIDNGELLTLGK